MNDINDKNNHLISAELSTEQNTNMIDGIMNNAPLPPPMPDEKELDKVKEQTQRKRSRELER